jgi:putative molybdopterin biosynthesis protein
MNHIPEVKQLYTPEQLAQLLQVTRRTVYVWIRQRKLAAVWAGNRVRIQPEAVEAFLMKK